MSGCLASEINVPTSCPQTRRRCLWRRPIRTFEREIYVLLGVAGDKSWANVHFQAEPSDRRRVERREVQAEVGNTAQSRLEKMKKEKRIKERKMVKEK